MNNSTVKYENVLFTIIASMAIVFNIDTHFNIFSAR